MLLQNVTAPDTAAADEQRAYAARVRTILAAKYTNTPSAAVVTYGCQQNVSDSERIKGLLCEMGYRLTDDPKSADFVVFNTCAVREHAELRVFGNVGSYKNIKRNRAGMMLCICGCMVQQPQIAEKIKNSYPYVDIVMGTHIRHRLPELVYRRLTEKRRIFNISDEENIIAEGTPIRRDGKFKAWLPIMSGCNNFCTYCIVPYVRGREISREPDAVAAEAAELVASGVKEITLLGQNVNSYNGGGISFPQLLRRINAIDGDFRIRFMTSHPKDCTDELLIAMSECEKVCRHLHLPVQSGSDEILKRMNRRYTSEKYLSLINRARELMPDIELTSDIIVGFPGETYKDFEDTLRLVEKVGYYSLFTFIYSKRTGTPAATMPDDTTRAEKSKRFGELLRLQENISDKINRALVGKTVRVLVEKSDRNEGMLSGKGNGYATVDFEGDPGLEGTFANVLITDYDGILKGKLI